MGNDATDAKTAARQAQIHDLMGEYVGCMFTPDHRSGKPSDFMFTNPTEEAALSEKVPGTSLTRQEVLRRIADEQIKNSNSLPSITGLQEEALAQAWSRMSKKEQRQMEKEESTFCTNVFNETSHLSRKHDIVVPALPNGPGEQAFSRRLGEVTEELLKQHPIKHPNDKTP